MAVENWHVGWFFCKLLEQTVAHSGLVADAMPSRPQIKAFLVSRPRNL